ncbi:MULTISPECIES: DNA polymerase III subunit gamma/tau [Prochlorococcus]|uniref:DNA polymerase III subunit gamma/tau n=1 Tax=Prochlorococcus TaxID=1218 RepID=UPI000533A028|nr:MULTISPECIES: DNA polymerase III subunit gamma/tau [Prochlorococcus]KGG13687.1 DNA polymerasee III subunits gamma and tau [Prochlorococcus sp. MIT 0601]
MSNHYLPLHQKYRPQRFDDLVGQELIATTLKQALISKKIAPAYLFCGPRGTGKTSSARILAKSLNCLNGDQPTISPCGSCNLCKAISNGNALDVIEIDAASNTGVDNIRDLIEKSKFAPVQARWKVYVIDECHMLSTAAFNALLKTLEEPPTRVVFILATTDPQRLLATIVSRCQRFDFRQISLENLIQHLQVIADKEEIRIDEESISLIAKRSQGGLRDAQSLLDQLSLLTQPLTIESVWEFLGEVPEEKLLDLTCSITNNDPVRLLKTSKEMLDNGNEPMAILQGLTSILRDLIIQITSSKHQYLCTISKESIPRLEEVASQTNLEKALQWQLHLKGAETQLRHSAQPRLWLEVILLGMLAKQVEKTGEVKKDLLPRKFKQQEKSLSIDTHEKKNPIDKDMNDTYESPIEKTDEAINPSVPSQNIKEIWEEILAQIELPSTRMLLSQQAELIHLSENQVEIRVSNNWLGMIQSRKKVLEKSILKVLGDSRQIILSSQQVTAKPIESRVEKDKNVNVNNQQLIVKKEIKNTDSKINSNYSKNDLTKNYKKNPDYDNNIDSSTEQFANFFNGEIITVEED